MTPAEIRDLTLEALLREADRHRGAAELAAHVRRVNEKKQGGPLWDLMRMVERARLGGWLERHLAPRPGRVAYAVPFAGCVPAPIAAEAAEPER